MKKYLLGFVIILFLLITIQTPVFAQENTPTPTPGCMDLAPGGTVQLKTASASGSHDIMLTWTDALDPVSYYLLTYGMEPGKYLYGNPNMGGRGTTSYTVGGLTKGKTYYFVVRAGNGCTPGTFSNELSAVAGETPTPTPAPTDTPMPTPTPEPPTPTATPTPVPQVLAAETSSTTGPNSLIGYVMLGVTAFGVLLVIVSGFLLLRMRGRHV